MIWKTAAVLGLAMACGWAQQAQTRKLLAVFAHPDDETSVGPLLAHYARQAGTQVYLIIATNGDLGVQKFAGIEAGAPLSAARAKEAICACEKLGIRPPILLGMPDGKLGVRPVLQELVPKLEQAMVDVKPDVIVTWGPDGGYGHPDHRMVSAVVTQVVEKGSVTPRLFYTAFPKSRMTEEVVKALTFLSPFSPTEDRFLTTRVPYSAEESAAAYAALQCHKTQFTAESMAQLRDINEKMNGGLMYLRPWFGTGPAADIFGK